MPKFIAGMITGILITSAFFLLRHRWLHTFDNNVVSIENTEPEYTEESGLPKDFLVFYDRFHSDSVYQLSHILFPLEGLPPDTDSLTANNGTFRWQKETWVLHKHFDSMEGNYTQQFIPFGANMVVEQIRHAQASYGMQRRFAKFDDEWQLIYYGAMNRLAE